MKRDSVSAYIRSDTPSRSCTHFGWHPLSPQQLRSYVIDGPFLNQKTYKDIRILYWNINIKINFFSKKYMVVRDEINIQECSIDQKSS